RGGSVPIRAADRIRGNVRGRDAAAPDVSHPRRHGAERRERAAARADEGGEVMTGAAGALTRQVAASSRDCPGQRGYAARADEGVRPSLWLLMLLLAAPALAQSVAVTSRGIVVAHDGV